MSEQLFGLPLPHGFLAWLLRAPVWFYRFHLGSLLGDRFLMLTHTGRKTGHTYQTVIEVVQHDQTTGTYYVVSGWGEKSSWYKNITANPVVSIQVRNRHFSAAAKRVTPEKGAQIILQYAHEHPLALRELSKIMKYPLDGSEESACKFGENIPVIAFQTQEYDKAKP